MLSDGTKKKKLIKIQTGNLEPVFVLPCGQVDLFWYALPNFA